MKRTNLFFLIVLFPILIFSQSKVEKLINQAQKAEYDGNVRLADSLVTLTLQFGHLSKKEKNQARSDAAYYKIILAKYAEADQLLIISEKYFIKHSAQDSSDLARIWDRKGLLLFEERRHPEAFYFYQKAYQIRKKSKSVDTLSLAISHEHLGEYYLENEHLDSSAWHLEAGSNLLPANHFMQARFLTHLGRLANTNGQIDKAEDYFRESMSLQLRLKIDRHFHYGKTLGNLAAQYADNGNNKDALEYYEKCLSNLGTALGTSHPDYAQSLNNLGVIYEITNNLSKAANCYQRAKSIFEKADRVDDFLNTSYNLGVIEKRQSNFKSAAIIFEAYCRDWEKIKGGDNSDYAWGLSNVAQCLASDTDTMQWERANQLSLQALNLYKKSISDQHIDFLNFVVTQCLVQETTGRIELATKSYKKAAQIIQQQAKDVYPLFSEEERQFFYEGTLLQFSQRIFSFGVKNPNRVEGEMFDLEATLKGLALQISRASRFAALSTQDTVVINAYKDWRELNGTMQHLYLEGQNANSFARLDSLREQSDLLEKKISRKVKNNINNQIQVVQNTDKELAIIDFFKSGTQYFALAKRVDTLICVNLGSIEAIDVYLEEEIASYASWIRNPVLNAQFSKILWQPLEPHLHGITKLLISPVGNLHNVAFHALSIQHPTQRDKSIFLIEKYKIQTSLSPIENHYPEKIVWQNKKIALFGGAFFDEKSAADNASLLAALDTTRGSSFSFLRGTLDETDSLSHLFKQKAWHVALYNGFNASEENLRNMETQKPDIIHLATHGFFMAKANLRKGISNSLENRVRQSEGPLLRSGIALARANISWKSTEQIAPENDGIITALEIGNLDFSGVELIALSACETARGEINDTEGVFGLQRAFKQAGAKSLLVSLWKVPDATTQRLMQSFYKNLLLLDDTHAALRQAQLEMSKNGLDPYFWAAFILVE
jgi:CHAT domain-containing protein/tetratricopeptide (TPR) repeat protein